MAESNDQDRWGVGILAICRAREGVDYNAPRSLDHTLIEREKLEAIIFAGTDLAFVFHGENTDFRHVDGARFYLKAIMAELLR